MTRPLEASDVGGRRGEDAAAPSDARAVWIAAAAYASVYFVLGWDRFATYHAGSDVGLFTQTLTSAMTGFTNTTENGSHFTVHFSPILFLCAPLVISTHSPLALVGIQAALGALAAPPLYYLARRRLPQSLAVGVACVALVYPPLAGVTFTDFHENGLVPALTLWLLYCTSVRRFAWAGLFAALLLCVKEDQATILALLGLIGAAWYVRRGDIAAAGFSAATVLVSVAVFVGFFEIVRPFAGAGAGAAWIPAHFYDWKGIVASRGSAPWWSIGRPAYFLEALVPLAFVPLLSPAFVLALPGFAEDLLSRESITYTMGEHYAAIWIPYVLFAFALAVVRIHERAPSVARRVLAASLVLCVLVLAFASPTHWGHYLRPVDANDTVLDRVLAGFPQDASVGAPDEIFAHLGFDPNASLGLARRPQFAIVDVRHADSALGRGMRLRLRSAASGYRLMRREDGVELYQSTALLPNAGMNRSVAGGRAQSWRPF